MYNAYVYKLIDINLIILFLPPIFTNFIYKHNTYIYTVHMYIYTHADTHTNTHM